MLNACTYIQNQQNVHEVHENLYPLIEIYANLMQYALYMLLYMKSFKYFRSLKKQIESKGCLKWKD